MARNVRPLHCSPEAVFDVLANGWLYPLRVVGASRMRDVSDESPNEGAELHHSFGCWPARVNDTAVLRVWDPPRRAVLEPHGRPIGIARVSIDVKPRADGCVVRLLAQGGAPGTRGAASAIGQASTAEKEPIQR